MDKSVRKTFFYYTLPSILAMAFSGIYTIIDGMFIGNFIGDAGIAAINIAYPLQALILAVGSGIGLGGGILISIAEGRGDKDEKRRLLGTTLALLLIADLLFLLLLLPSYRWILSIIADDASIYPHAVRYIRPILLLSIFQLLSTGLVPVIRNYGGAVYTMNGMIAGFVSNIILDYLFIAKLHIGLEGAAYATLIGQAISLVVSSSFFITHPEIPRSMKLDYKKVPGILKSGLSPFGETINPNISLLVMNYFILKTGGLVASSTYGVLSYTYFIALLFFQGLGQGAQPLVSLYHGSGDGSRKKEVESLMMTFSLLLFLLLGTVLLVTRNSIPRVFGASFQVARMYAHAIPYFILALFFFAMVQRRISILYASKKEKESAVLIYLQSILTAVLAFLFTRFLGIEGAWLVQPFALLIVLLLSIAKRNRQE